jgi:nitroreductase
MNLVDGLKKRRSIRKFTDKKITTELIKEIVDIAAFAPSWKNSQTTRYVLVLDEGLKNVIADDCMMNFEFNQNTVNSAPALVVVTTVNKRSGYERDGSFTTSKETHWQSFDAGIATQSLCLAAFEKGLGTVIMGIFDEEKIKEALAIDENQSVSAIVAIGYADEAPEAPKRKNSDELLTVK